MPSRSSDPRITEQRNPRTVDLDLASPLEIVDLMSAEDALVAPAVAAQREQIARAIEMAADAFRAGGRLIHVGAGTSGRLGVLDAAECPPTFGTIPEMVLGVIAGGSDALVRAVEGAEDRGEDGRIVMDERGVGAGDMVVGIAASGSTPFVLEALRRAHERGAGTVILACTPPAEELLAVADIAIVPVVGPEVIAGSTRLKAGTATKMVLNMISTGAMVRIGKTFGNLMVDLRATNAKLADRAQRIVMELCDLARDDARALLLRSDGSVKVAIVMHFRGVDRAGAERLLVAAGGSTRLVLAGVAPGEREPEDRER